MPVRQLSNPSSAASASSAKETTISTLRMLTTDGESSAGAVGSSTTISVSGVAIGPFVAQGASAGHHPQERLTARRATAVSDRGAADARLSRRGYGEPYFATNPASVIKFLFRVSSSSRNFTDRKSG